MTSSILIIGGGAAGFFSAIRCAEVNPGYKVIILEKLPYVLGKVKISGGGRCNVTNILSDPKEIIKFYPRGGKQLLNLFYHFGTKETIGWFKNRGVELKYEIDGRVFPITDNSQTIIDCLIKEATKLNVEILTTTNIEGIRTSPSGWEVFNKEQNFTGKSVIVTTGSDKKIWRSLGLLGHKIVEPVPSLFTFNLYNGKDITDLAGVSLNEVELKIKSIKQICRGPLLITHWGISGPAVLKLSAFAARELHDLNYTFTIHINWLPELNKEQLVNFINKAKLDYRSKAINTNTLFGLPGRLWNKLLLFSNILEGKKWNDISRTDINKLSDELHQGEYFVTGKSTFKEEFVTAGGVDLEEVNLKTMESKIHKGLFLAGEVLNIDGVTGGFNFQSAWTTGYIAGSSQV